MSISVLKRLRFASRQALRPDVKRKAKHAAFRHRLAATSTRLSHLMFAGLFLAAAVPSVRGEFQTLRESEMRPATLHAAPLPKPDHVATLPARSEAKSAGPGEGSVLRDSGVAHTVEGRGSRSGERSPVVPPIKREPPTNLALAVRPASHAPALESEDRRQGVVRPAAARGSASETKYGKLEQLTARKVPLPVARIVRQDDAPKIALASLSDMPQIRVAAPPKRLVRVRRRGRDVPAKIEPQVEKAAKVAALSSGPPPESERPIGSVMKGARYTVVPTWSELDIAEARRVCGSVLAGRKVVASEAPAVREGSCGAPAPLRVSKLGEPSVEVRPSAMLTCPMAAALDRWITEVVQPAALATFGAPVTRLVSMSSYSCRNRYGRALAPLSEHALINAVDLAGFVLRDGRTVKVVSGWGPVARDKEKIAAKEQIASEHHPEKVRVADATKGKKKTEGVSMLGAGTLAKEGGKPAPKAANAATDKEASLDGAKPDGGKKSSSAKGEAAEGPPKPAGPPEKSEKEKRSEFLRKVHADACSIFGTVLGPEANDAHRNHFHLDMKARRGKRGYCQ